MKDPDLDTALAALARRRDLAAAGASGSPCPSPTTRTNRRAAIGLLLIGLLIGGTLQLTAPDSIIRDPNKDSRAAKVFANAQPGTCLSWPADEPDKPSFVQCSSDHLFEVARSVDMDAFAEPCQRAVSEYLGPRYDPNSRFTSGVLWAGDAAAAPSDRKLLCGLQLLGMGAKPMPFTGLVAELDQSKVWPVGTCLGVDGATTVPTDEIVDCAQPHAAEVAGSVSLAERFTSGPPSEADQDSFLREECARLAEGYLAPGGLQTAELVAQFTPLARASWAAGSRQVSCNVAPPAGAEWKPLLGRVGRVQSDVPAPAAPAAPAAPVAPVVPAPVAPPPAPVVAPPPVYTEPLAPAPTAEPVAPPPVTPSPAESTPAPSPESPAPPSPAAPSPASPSPASPPPGPSPGPSTEQPLGPPPGPAPGEIPPEPPPPNVVEIPGLAPITLPFPPP